jgi:hypothetical protein
MSDAATATKWCPGCEEDLPLAAFTKNKAKPDGRGSPCRECKKAVQNAWYAKNRDRHIANVKKNKSTTHRALLSWLLNYLKTHPCVDCGEADPLVLELDHVRGAKTMAVATMLQRQVQLAKLEKEVAKCEVRCANCHRRKTAKQFKHLRYLLLAA